MARDGFVTVRHDSPSFATKVPTNLPTTFRRAWALGNCGSIPPTRRDVVGSTPADHRRDTGRPRGPPTIHFEVLHEEEPMPARRRAKTRRPGPPAAKRTTPQRCRARTPASRSRSPRASGRSCTRSYRPRVRCVPSGQTGSRISGSARRAPGGLASTRGCTCSKRKAPPSRTRRWPGGSGKRKRKRAAANPDAAPAPPGAIYFLAPLSCALGSRL